MGDGPLAHGEEIDERPLLITLALDAATSARLNAERRAHFPPERNFLDAHLTLFHKLPATLASEIRQFLSEMAASQSPVPLRAIGYRSLGRGVALDFDAPELNALHRRIAERFAAYLTPQDKQKLRPHVTIQNKVDPAAAKELLTEKQRSFAPFAALGTGFALWRYDGGPWEEMKIFSFAGARAERI